MASHRTTARAHSAIAGTHTGRKESARQNEPGTAPADAELPLTHDPDVPGRASLPLAARRLFGRMMEVFAGFLTQADHQAGRLIEFLPQPGELDTG
jgi:arylsulfatase A-like enzyme